MAETYSNSLKLTNIGDGDLAGTWGQTTNTNICTLLEQAITGVIGITMTDANYTLSNINGTSDEARNAVIVVSGTNTAIRTVYTPYNSGSSKLYTFFNNTTGGYAIQIQAANSGTPTGNYVTIPSGVTAAVYFDGINFYSAITGSAGNFTVNGTLTATGVTDTGALSVGGNLSVTGTSTMTGATVLTGAVSGAGINAYLASPPAIGGTAPAAGAFTTVTASSTVTATGAVTGSTANDSLGNVRNIVQQTKSAPYTLVATDNGQCIITNSGVTVPASVFVAGNVVTIYNNSGSTITITQGSGLTLQFAGQSTSTTGNRSLSLYGITTVLFLSASSAVITGAGMY